MRAHVKGNLALLVIVGASLFCLSFTRANRLDMTTSSSYPVHNLDTGLNYATIQEAVDANQTVNGQRIGVDSGTYYEHVNIYKSLTLVGEERDLTIVDGNGTGSVIQISAGNVSVFNFTVRNAGKTWYGKGYPDSCVRGNGVAYVDVENNTLADAAVCAWFYSSSFVNVSGNIVSSATVMGIVGYTSSSMVMDQNLVENCGGIGLHLDGNSVNCNIVNNTVTNCLEGIELEKSAGNSVEGNRLLSDNASVVLNQCGGPNVLRENNMTSESYNLIVWGWAAEAFVQDIDTSNVANGKKVYYFVNSNNLTIDQQEHPDVGFLAIVNCTNMMIRDLDLSLNRDGLLIAKSASCSLMNITLSGNLGPFLYGGMTFFESNNNSVVNSRISNNTAGVCLYDSAGNTFYHNSFVNNSRQVVSDFHDPFSAPSGSHSINIWDNGFEGNYWSDYDGTDTNPDGIGDTPHVIDSNNTDDHPLMGEFYSFDLAWGTETYRVSMISNSTISNVTMLAWLSSPTEYLKPGQRYLWFSVTGEDNTTGFCRLVMPKSILNATSYVALVDGQPVNTTELPISNSTHAYLYFTYQQSTHEIIIVSEFPSILVLPLLTVATLTVVIGYKRKSIRSYA